MPFCRFSLNLSQDQFLLYYRGVVRQIQVTTEEGKTLQFPAGHLRPFLTHQGIRGRFALQYDEGGKFVNIEKIG